MKDSTKECLKDFVLAPVVAFLGCGFLFVAFLSAFTADSWFIAWAVGCLAVVAIVVAHALVRRHRRRQLPPT